MLSKSKSGSLSVSKSRSQRSGVSVHTPMLRAATAALNPSETLKHRNSETPPSAPLAPKSRYSRKERFMRIPLRAQSPNFNRMNPTHMNTSPRTPIHVLEIEIGIAIGIEKQKSKVRSQCSHSHASASFPTLSSLPSPVSSRPTTKWAVTEWAAQPPPLQQVVHNRDTLTL
jgi:hypothetical protein